MKFSLKNLLSRSYRVLLEADEGEKEPNDSLDSQIDKFLIEYESEAKSSKNEGLDIRLLTRRMLFEQEDDEKKDDEKDEPKKISPDEIDMSSFVSSVMRLVDNYDSLLEVRNTILRRAKNYVIKNYEKEAADIFDDTLRESFGMEIGKSESEMKDEFEAPRAAEAGPKGGGGGA